MPTVQETVEAAIGELTGEKVRVVAAGRTDAGVHAVGQVIQFATCSSIPVERWPAALNSRLPPAIRAWRALQAPASFHVRYDAARKLYRYRFYYSPIEAALSRHYAVAVWPPLDTERMAQAALRFEGEHDLRAFCGAGRRPRSWRRRIFRCRLLPDPPLAAHTGDFFGDRTDLVVLGATGREDTWSGPGWSFWVEAEGFLYHQVRTMVGTLWEIGRGERSPVSLDHLLTGVPRAEAGPTAPARGLYLMAVAYPREALWPQPGVSSGPPNSHLETVDR